MRIIKHVSTLLTIVYVYIDSGYAQTSPNPLVPISGTKTCKAPLQPQNGHWKLHRSQCSNTEQDCDISEGMNLGLGSHLIYSCNPGYKIKGSMDVSCVEGKWLNIPSCIKIRCQKLNTTSIIAHCIYNNEWVSCDYSILPGTRAKLFCRDSYQYESNLPSRRRNFARCNENGQWVPQPIICIPDDTVAVVGNRHDFSSSCLTETDISTNLTLKIWTDLRIDFALDSLKKAALIESKDNIFFSPHSIHQALSLAYFGARGTTESSLKQALRIPEHLTKVDVHRYYIFEKSLNQLHSQMNESTDYEYKVANKFWITNSRKLRDCIFDLFGDQMQVTDFRTNPAEVRTRINDWVSNMTKGHIRDLLPPNSISGDTDLVLANAAYFKGKWAQHFDPKNSKRDIFYASGTQHFVITFMHQKGNFNYVVSEELGVHILEVPYKGNDISMFILLPPFFISRALSQDSEPQDSIRQLVERLAAEKGSRKLRQLLDDGMPSREVEVNLPRFEIERELQLNQLLYALGAGELLSPEAADLRGFVADGEPSLHLGDAIHRARIVTEEGTTGAAITANFTFRSIEPAIFNANHPFVYLIYDKHDRTVLFTGIFRSPANSLASVPFKEDSRHQKMDEVQRTIRRQRLLNALKFHKAPRG